MYLLISMAILAVCATGAFAGQRSAPDIKLDSPAPAEPKTAPKAANPISSNTVILRINGEEVKEGKLDEMTARVFENIQKQYGIGADGLPQEMRDNVRAKVIEQLKQQVIINQAVKKLNVTPSKEQIDKELSILETQIQMEGGEKMTMKDWITEMKAKDPTFSEEALRDQVKTQLQVMAVVENEAKAKIDPTTDEIKKTYDKDSHRWGKVRASHILILSKPQQGDATAVDKDALTKAQGVLKEVKAGKTDFAELAKKYSEDKGSAEKGGDVGFFFYETMVPQFSAKAFAQKNGQVSDLVQTQYGYHIIKTVDFQPATLETSKNRIILAARSEKVNTILKPAIDSLMKTAKVEDLGPKPAAAPMTSPHGMMMAPPAPEKK